MANRVRSFRANVRPHIPESQPQYYDNELKRLFVIVSELHEATALLTKRVAALETP